MRNSDATESASLHSNSAERSRRRPEKHGKFKQLSSQKIVENKTNYLYLPALNTIYVKKCFMVFAQCSHFDQSHSTAETVSLDISLAMLQRNL